MVFNWSKKTLLQKAGDPDLVLKPTLVPTVLLHITTTMRLHSRPEAPSYNNTPERATSITCLHLRQKIGIIQGVQ